MGSRYYVYMSGESSSSVGVEVGVGTTLKRVVGEVLARQVVCSRKIYAGLRDSVLNRRRRCYGDKRFIV